MCIVAMHAAAPVVASPIEKRSETTVKPEKVKKPIVLPKTAVGIVKSIPTKKIWMILLPQAPLNGLCRHHGWKFRRLLLPVFDAVAIFAVGRVKL